MFGWSRFFRGLPLFPLVTGMSLAIGCLVPTVYEWTQASGARGQLDALGTWGVAILLITAAVCGLVMRLRRNETLQPAASPLAGRFQFGIRDVLVATTVIAAVLAVVPRFAVPAGIGLVVALAIGMLIWACCAGPAIALRTAGILASLFFPFVWMIAYNVPFGRTSGLVSHLPLGPGVLFGVIMDVLAGIAGDTEVTVALSAVILQLAAGAWLARRGPKAAAIYMALVLASSSLGSLILHALYRA